MEVNFSNRYFEEMVAVWLYGAGSQNVNKLLTSCMSLLQQYTCKNFGHALIWIKVYNQARTGIALSIPSNKCRNFLLQCGLLFLRFLSSMYPSVQKQGTSLFYIALQMVLYRCVRMLTSDDPSASEVHERFPKYAYMREMRCIVVSFVWQHPTTCVQQQGTSIT